MTILHKLNGIQRHAATDKKYPSEHEEQVKVIAWAREHESKWPELGLLYAIPNGGARDRITGAQLKAEGVRPGMPDLCLPVSAYAYNALYIELKSRGPRARVSVAQKKMIKKLENTRNRVDVCRGADEAIKTLTWYLKWADSH